MKNILTLLFAFTVFGLTAQTKMVPGNPTIETKWIKNEKYQMLWMAVRGEEKHLVARINYQVVASPKKLSILSSVDVNKATTTWIDSTIVAMPSLKPIHHYSDNLERAVSLYFGKKVTGKYEDKVNKKKTVIDDAVTGEYFDSNFYPYLVRLLPLKEGYTQEITTYDYSPAKKGLMSASITKVKSGTYQSKKAGLVPVWIVSSVETVKGQQTNVDYYIAKKDRTIWKQDIFDGYQTTRIERLEM